MGTNSIKTNLSKADIISELRLSIGADIKREYTFLIVEGDDDIKFWKDIANEKVTLFESFSGKEGIKEIVQTYFDTNPRVIGVRDRDYERNCIDPKIFFYDYCCLEMMLIKNDEVFKCIYNEYYSGQLSPNELRKKILLELKYLSLIRSSNEIQRLGIKIDGVSIDNVFDNKKNLIDIRKIISTLNQINKNYFSLNMDKLSQIAAENESPLNFEELLSITQGHDFIKLFAIFCRKPKGSALGDKSIAAGLRCAYRKIDFMSTTLYSQLVSYETQYSLKIVS